MMDEHEHDLAKLLAGANLVLERYLGTPGNSATDTCYLRLSEVRDSIDRELTHYRFRVLAGQLRLS